MSNSTMPHSNCIVLDHINKSFGEKQILEHVNLVVPYGSIYGLLGPSGCGKTTTVKIIAGIMESSSGSAYVFGSSMPDLALMQQIGYMAQSDALYTALSAKENLEFFGTVYGLRREALQERIGQVCEIVKLGEHLDKPVAAYSGGMKRRLSLATALLHNPKLLVLDEPTVGIDPLLRADIWMELRRIASSGVTILVTTHVMDEAEKCSNLSMMRDGHIIASGAPKDIIASCKASSLEEAFIIYGKESEACES